MCSPAAISCGRNLSQSAACASTSSGELVLHHSGLEAASSRHMRRAAGRFPMLVGIEHQNPGIADNSRSIAARRSRATSVIRLQLESFEAAIDCAHRQFTHF